MILMEAVKKEEIVVAIIIFYRMAVPTMVCLLEKAWLQ
jgi:hypothetical protein